jgi:hypothetical protein
MPRKPIERPPAVARAFVKDMRTFLAEKNAIKRDEIAARCTRSRSFCAFSSELPALSARRPQTTVDLFSIFFD